MITFKYRGVPVEAIFIMGVGSCSSLNSYPYASTDKWEIFSEGGNCHFNTQSNDAMDHWRCDLNANLNYRDKFIKYYFTDRYSVCFSPLQPSGCQGYEMEYLSTDQEVYGIDLENPNDPTPWDNWYDYLLFYNTEWSPNFHTCANDDEMDFYYEEMAALSIEYCPTGKVVGKHGVGNEIIWSENATFWTIMRVDYFTRNVITSEGDDEPSELPCASC